jgi:tetratricopeptide (TPR) repeat protein
MPGDGNLFEEALKRGSSFAWNEEWEKAVAEYRRALEESPGDARARNYLAMALYRSGQLTESLEAYKSVCRAEPENVAALGRIAELQETLGDAEAAAAGRRALAELHTRRGAHAEALKCWQKAVELRPDNLTMWEALMDTAVHQGAVASVLAGYVAAAGRAVQRGAAGDARRLAERARTLAPDDSSIAALLSDISEVEERPKETAPRDEVPLPGNVVKFVRSLDPTDKSREASQSTPSAVATPSVDGLPPSASVAIPVEAARTVVEAPPVVPPIATGQAPAPAAPEAGKPGAEAAPGRQDHPEAPAPRKKKAARRESLQGWGSGSIDFGLGETSEAKGPEPDAEPQPDTEPQPGVEPAARPQQGKGLLGRMIGFIWQPNEDEQDQSGVPAQPEILASPPSSGPSGTGTIDFGLAEPPKADQRRRERSGPWGIKDFGLAEGLRAEPAPATAEPPQQETPAAAPPGDVAAEASPAAVTEATGVSEPPPVMDGAPEAGRKEGNGATAEAGASGNGLSAAELVEMAALYLQMGKMRRAKEAYQHALEADPDLPAALIGMARLHLSLEELDDAMSKLRKVLKASLPEASEDALELMLEVLKEKAARRDLGAVAETLLWLRSSLDRDRVPRRLMESLLSMPVELLGRTAGEHLEEVVLPPADVRGDFLLALWDAEDDLRHGRLRTAADGMYRLLAARPDFLPAQSLLGRVLVSQGRVEEARERADRLVRLYELRGEEGRALEVLWWAVAQRVLDGDARKRLAGILRAQNRHEEADLVELGWVEPATRPASSRTGGKGSGPRRVASPAKRDLETRA